MTNLKDLVEIVRQSRERTADVFPLPSIDDCIDFAITEAAEYIDARKRENPIYKRNRDREHSPRKEWGQCGYMIASAVIQVDTSLFEDTDWQPLTDVATVTVYEVIITLSQIRIQMFIDEGLDVDALDEWAAFAVKWGADPAELLRETCAAFEAKHLKVAA